ncbi:unnamed protein product, partial [Nesidiocoris tenuis]
MIYDTWGRSCHCKETLSKAPFLLAVAKSSVLPKLEVLTATDHTRKGRFLN